jgi:hypothetical protein
MALHQREATDAMISTTTTQTRSPVPPHAWRSARQKAKGDGDWFSLSVKQGRVASGREMIPLSITVAI